MSLLYEYFHLEKWGDSRLQSQKSNYKIEIEGFGVSVEQCVKS